MAQIFVIYWRDIPAQVIAETGRGRNRKQAKRELHKRFALAIDEAAMKFGLDKSEDYLEDWRRGDSLSCADALEDEVEMLVNQIEQAFSATELRKLVENGGNKKSS